ncbi:AIPR family protein [Candidatus Protofrankia californiensis]|uniref:AIPR family protein n=1 Tax=Candidatus Protofrankia californiensis TaxID=1839754 RepID=UPI00104120C6|nr:AIPR family protein [Candidatus Protofrankia californiensis]
MSGKAGRSIPGAVTLVRQALLNQFEDLIDTSDVTHPDPAERHRKFLSRALAALVARDRADCDASEAAEMVIDGRADFGIDAIAVARSEPRLWLIQSKWSDRGEAGIGAGDALKTIEGLRLIDQHQFDRFNERFQVLAERVRAVLLDADRRITVTIALMGSQQPSAEVRQKFDDAVREFNRFGEVLDVEYCLARDINNVLGRSIAPKPVDLAIRMQQWFDLHHPFEAYSGIVAAGEIAEWYTRHGDRLFSKNIRTNLGITKVNSGVVETLTTTPENFWYYNNGITVLCNSLSLNPFSRSAARGPAELVLDDASVVNGAQTVAAIAEAMRKSPEIVGGALVGVRVIVVGRAPAELATTITQTTNTQNDVELRDFVALDRVQTDIKDDFALTLDKVYVIKRGEIDPPPEGGCSIVHAAIALACAHPDVELAVRAKRDSSLLWERGSKGAYTQLFGRRPSALRIWRCVQTLRAVQEGLHESRNRRRGRAEAVAEHGDLLVTHIVFAHITLSGADDPDEDWLARLSDVSTLVEQAVGWLVLRIDESFGKNSFIGSTLTSADRCRPLVKRVLWDMSTDRPDPVLPDDYNPAKVARRTRRPNTVGILVDARRIKDGTRLVFSTISKPEERAVGGWLAADPRRAEATWVNSRSKPLVWAVDGRQYAPSTLVQEIWRQAAWEQAPVAVQGPARWSVPAEGSLVELAEVLLRADAAGAAG